MERRVRGGSPCRAWPDRCRSAIIIKLEYLAREFIPKGWRNDTVTTIPRSPRCSAFNATAVGPVNKKTLSFTRGRPRGGVDAVYPRDRGFAD